MTKDVKDFFLTLLALILAIAAGAQTQGTGIGTINPDASSKLEVSSTSQGFLPPRMTTAQRDAISNPAIGLMVFNTDSKCSEVFLGIGAAGAGSTGWKNLCKANINATFSAGSLSCSGTPSGNYVATVAMDATNYMIVTVNTLTAGDYSISTDEQNGVTFAAEGTIASVGSGTQLKMKANGTPFASGSFTYTVTLSGQTCSFSVTFGNPPAKLQNGAVTCSGGTLSGNYTEGNATVSSIHTRTVTVTPASIGYCNLTTNTANGIKFSGSATFTAGQVGTPQTITLAASGTPADSGTYSYTISGTNVTSGCSFSVTFAGRKAILFGTLSGVIDSTGGDITFTSMYNTKLASVTGTQITLLPGRTYYLQADIFAALSAAQWANFVWVDAANSALPGASLGTIQSLNRPTTDSDKATSVAYISPTVPTVVKLRIVQNGNVTTNVNPGYSKFFIKELLPNNLYYSGKSTAQTFTAAGQYLNLTQLLNNTVSGNSITSAGNVINLKGGKTYKLTANIFPAFTPNASATRSYATFNWVDGSGAAFANQNAAVLFAQSDNTNENIQHTAIAIVSPSSDIQAKLQLATLAANNTLSMLDGLSSILVEEINPAQLYYFGKVSDQSITAGSTDMSVTQVVNNSNNGQSITSSGTTITLKAGRTYFVNARTFGGFSASTSAYYVYQIANADNTQVALSKRGAALGMNYNSTENNQPEVSGIIQATTDTQIKLRSVFQGDTYGIQAYYSPLLIIEL